MLKEKEIFTTPNLSICIPAYNRPQWLKRALKSIISSNRTVEIIVSDDSTTDECQKITKEILNIWQGNWKYVSNQPSLGMAPNWNNCLKLANGKYVLILHDDDFLLKNGVENILTSLEKYQDDYPVLLFGVHVVYEQEELFKKQLFAEQLYLSPAKALEQLMCNSSFVRFPGIVISRAIFEDVGYFDVNIGGVADLEMWIRLFSKYGVLCVPLAASAYTIHEGALTTAMFKPLIVEKILFLFDQVKKLDLLDPQILLDCQTKYFHQFILGGTYRQLRQGKLDDADKVMQLFELDEIKKLKTPAKWLLVRLIFTKIIWNYRLIKNLNKSSR